MGRIVGTAGAQLDGLGDEGKTLLDLAEREARQQQVVADLVGIRIHLRGALIVTDGFEGIAELLVDITDEVMQFGLVMSEQQICGAITGDDEIAGLEVRQHQIIRIFVIRSVVGGGTLEIRYCTLRHPHRQKLVPGMMVGTGVLGWMLFEFLQYFFVHWVVCRFGA